MTARWSVIDLGRQWPSLPMRSAVPPHESASHPELDPNNEFDPVALSHWLNFSDFYQWPHITYFDSFDHLVSLLSELQAPTGGGGNGLSALSGKMQQYNVELHHEVSSAWEDVLTRAFEGEGETPRSLAPSRDFDASLAKMYGTSLSAERCVGEVEPYESDRSVPRPDTLPRPAVCFPRQHGTWGVDQGLLGDAAGPRRRGQIQGHTSFGAMLSGLASRADVARVVETGTWLGGGSTQVFAEALALKARCVEANDTHACCDAFVATFEIFEPAHRYAKSYHRGKPVWLLHAGTVDVSEMLTKEEIPDEDLQKINDRYHFHLYYERDRALMGQSAGRLEEVCRSLDDDPEPSRGAIDVALIDGNEYTGLAEFKIFHSACRPRFLALHDTGTLKTRAVEKWIEENPGNYELWAQGHDPGATWAIYSKSGVVEWP